MEGDGHRRGQRPGSGGPDDGGDLAAGQRRIDGRRVRCEPVAHIDRRAGVVFVLDLGFGQGGAVVDAPVDRLQAAVDEAFLKKAVRTPPGSGLRSARHGLVGRFPAAKAADALKLRGLQVDVLLRVGAAGIQDRGSRHLQLLAAQLLVDLDLDGQAVAVVAGDVGGVEAGHGLGLDDEVLQALVQRVAQVNGSVGVGRAVVKQVDRAAAAGLAQLFIEPERGPASQPKRLILRQIGLHREGGLGQGKGRLQLRRRRTSRLHSVTQSYSNFSVNGRSKIFPVTN